MTLKADWAYTFSSDRSLEEVCSAFSEAGPWPWQLRENYIYGQYFNTRPEPGVHLRVHEYPQAFFKGPGGEGFSALLQIEEGSSAVKDDVDALFRSLLERVMASEITEIEPYD